ncbi:unnamed protein product [Sphenostylis stenocarpa]|uniref:Uncharacterized protein n=1 Tax=Sphenostylis stenocarpa TaxID=92480 RepID=A0AA86SPY3_9FABA|nr:unnamed protein product [Sphenostylis stenocarpa]
MIWLVVIIPWLNRRMRKYLLGWVHPPRVIPRNAFLVIGGLSSVSLERCTKILGGVGECKSIGIPAVQWKLRFKASRKADPSHEDYPRHVPLRAEAPYCWSASERRAHASLLARILT